VPTLRQWAAARVHLRRAKEASAAVVELLDRRVDAGQPIDAEFLQPMARKLEFVDVSYREPGTGRMVVENLSLSVPLDGRAVVVGSDAEEVRAVAYLLTRFLDPTAGEVRIDGKNLRWVTHESLRTQVSLVSRQNLVFNDTVANNIGCGDPGFTVPQIIEAAKVAHAHQFVQRLPYGYETAVGDAGVSLRPGEKLRLAIARAVLRDPSLIVVEEPDEPLDHDTKALLDDTFARRRCTRAAAHCRRVGTRAAMATALTASPAAVSSPARTLRPARYSMPTAATSPTPVRSGPDRDSPRSRRHSARV
jgi:ATP-binding cassette, subfamily B, bacterial